MKRWIAVSLAFVLSACVTGNTGNEAKPAFDTLAQAPLCCRSMADFPFVPVAAGESQEAEVGAASPAFEFYGERSFFQAFTLPAAGRPLTVHVEAFIPQPGFMFYPGLLFLNERKEPVFTVGPAEASYVRMDLVTRPRLYTVKTVDPQDGWRYVVVYTLPETLKNGRALRIRDGVGGPLNQPRSGEWYPQHRDAFRGVEKGAPASPTARIKVAVSEN